MTTYGCDYLGGRHYLKNILLTHPAGWAGGIFLTTFGNATKAVKKMAESGKFSDLVVHIAPFDYSHKYPINKLTKLVIQGAKFLEGVALANPSTRILASPFCEHNHKTSEMVELFGLIKAAAPHCELLNSIWHGGTVPGTITEIHLTNSRPVKAPKAPYTIAFDGFGGDGDGDFVDADIPTILERYKDARHIRLWNFRYNGKFGHLDKTPVKERHTWPNIEYLNGHNATMKKREGKVSWPKNALYKSFADDHGGSGPTKDNLAMCILPVSKPEVVVGDSKGKVIAKMKRLLPDHTNEPKGARYYSNFHAYQLGNLAERGTGSRLIKIDSQPLTDADLRSHKFK